MQWEGKSQNDLSIYGLTLSHSNILQDYLEIAMDVWTPLAPSVWQLEDSKLLPVFLLDAHVLRTCTNACGFPRPSGKEAWVLSSNQKKFSAICYHVTFDILRFVRYTYATYVTVTCINFKPKTELFNCTIKKYWHMRTFLEFFFCLLPHILFIPWVFSKMNTLLPSVRSYLRIYL